MYFIQIIKKQSNNLVKVRDSGWNLILKILWVTADIVSVKTDHNYFQKLNPVLSGLEHNYNKELCFSQFSHCELIMTGSFKHIKQYNIYATCQEC